MSSRNTWREGIPATAGFVALLALAGSPGTVRAAVGDAAAPTAAESVAAETQSRDRARRGQAARRPQAALRGGVRSGDARTRRGPVTTPRRPATIARVDRGPMVRSGPFVPRPAVPAADGARERDDDRWDRERDGRDRYGDDRVRRGDRDRYRYDERDRYRYGDRDRRPIYRPRVRHRSPRIGITVNFLPRGHRSIHVHGRDYWYHDGAYYGSYGRGYRVITAPVGAVVLVLPRYHEVIWFRGERLFYYDGVFYRADRRGRGYIVIGAPYGVEVPYLPDGYGEVWHGGSLYYHSHGVHYRPVRRSGITFFLSVRL